MTKHRIAEIDLLRGLAVILMLIFHFLFDLAYFFGCNISLDYGLWFIIGKISAVLFIMLAGLTSTLTQRNVNRGLLILAYGYLITIVTYIFYPSVYIRFGILHLLGICIIVSTWFKKLNSLCLLLVSAMSFIIGNNIFKLTTKSTHFIPFGITPENFDSLDYYPIIPWIGIFIVGMIIGKLFYSQQKSLLPPCSVPEILAFFSRHSLIIYLIHQPIFLAILHGWRILNTL